MNLTEERINHLSHLVLTAFKKDGRTEFRDETKGLIGIKKAIRNFAEVLEKIDSLVRQKIATLKRDIPVGSREWDVLYRKYFDEALAKKGL